MKKKILTTIAMFFPFVASAFIGEVDIDGVKYSISTKTQEATAIGISDPNYVGELVIHYAVEYEGKTCYVSSVDGFGGSTGITSVTIEEGITSIGYSAFQDCTSLAEIVIPKSMNDVGSQAFTGTSWYVNQEDGVVYLGHIAYKYKGEMPEDSEISIKEGTTIISKRCFNDQANLKYIHFPKTLKKIDEYAFCKCVSLLTVSLDGIDLYNCCFLNCYGLKEVSLNHVNFVEKNSDEYCFRGCNAIERVYINCKEVDGWFSKRPSITSLTLGSDVEAIKEDAFNGCTGIKSVVFPEGIKHLSGFSGCTGLTSISIPTTVETISGFGGCTGLTSIEIPSNVNTIDGYAFSNCHGIKSIVLSEGIRKIGDSAFQSCAITNIIIPNSVDMIGSGAFSGCQNLKEIPLPPNIKEIGGQAFAYCNELLSITLPNGLKSIEGGLCTGCTKLSKVVIPSSVTKIYGDAFEKCKDLEDVYCYAALVPTNAYYNYQGIHMFDGSPFRDSDISLATLHVPAQSIESYKAAKYWQDFGEIVAIPDYEAKKCATPRISYKNSKLEFTCDTEGAQFYSEITDTDIRSSTENVIDLTATYHISVYATAPDHAQSETMYATLCWIDAEPRTEGIENTSIATVRAQAVLIQGNSNTLNITGAAEGTPISVYDVTGKMAGVAKASAETTSISTKLCSGQIALVKIGKKTVKVIMR